MAASRRGRRTSTVGAIAWVKRAIKSELGESPTGLYQQILNRDYAYQIIPPAIPITTQGKERIPNVLQPTIAKQFIALSAFRQAVQLGTTGARLEHHTGAVRSLRGAGQSLFSGLSAKTQTFVWVTARSCAKRPQRTRATGRTTN